MDDFLARVLEKMNEMAKEDLEDLSVQFKAGLKNNVIAFGKHAFRKSFNNEGARSVINASLWDVMTTGLTGYPEHLVREKKNKIHAKLSILMADEDFTRSITSGTNDVKRVGYRFRATRIMFTEVFDA